MMSPLNITSLSNSIEVIIGKVFVNSIDFRIQGTNSGLPEMKEILRLIICLDVSGRMLSIIRFGVKYSELNKFVAHICSKK